MGVFLGGIGWDTMGYTRQVDAVDGDGFRSQDEMEKPSAQRSLRSQVIQLGSSNASNTSSYLLLNKHGKLANLSCKCKFFYGKFRHKPVIFQAMFDRLGLNRP